MVGIAHVMQACLGDDVSFQTTSLKQITQMFWISSAYESYVYNIYFSLLSM